MLLRREVDDGDDDAMYQLAAHLLRLNDPSTLDEALSLLRRATDAGHVQARSLLESRVLGLA